MKVFLLSVLKYTCTLKKFEKKKKEKSGKKQSFKELYIKTKS